MPLYIGLRIVPLILEYQGERNQGPVLATPIVAIDDIVGAMRCRYDSL